jgi:hypothetical protein
MNSNQIEPDWAEFTAEPGVWRLCSSPWVVDSMWRTFQLFAFQEWLLNAPALRRRIVVDPHDSKHSICAKSRLCSQQRDGGLSHSPHQSPNLAQNIPARARGRGFGRHHRGRGGTATSAIDYEASLLCSLFDHRRHAQGHVWGGSPVGAAGSAARFRRIGRDYRLTRLDNTVCRPKVGAPANRYEDVPVAMPHPGSPLG